jgi:hypothetical protein
MASEKQIRQVKLQTHSPNLASENIYLVMVHLPCIDLR